MYNYLGEDDELVILYHKATNTYWTNDLEWNDRIESEPVMFGKMKLKYHTIAQVQREMSRDGFYRLYDPTDAIKYLSGEKKSRLEDLFGGG